MQIAGIILAAALFVGAPSAHAQYYYPNQNAQMQYDPYWTVTSGYPPFISMGVPGGEQRSFYPQHPNYLGANECIMATGSAHGCVQPNGGYGYSGGYGYGGYGSGYGYQSSSYGYGSYGFPSYASAPMTYNPYMPIIVANMNSNTISNPITIGGSYWSGGWGGYSYGYPYSF